MYSEVPNNPTPQILNTKKSKHRNKTYCTLFYSLEPLDFKNAISKIVEAFLGEDSQNFSYLASIHLQNIE